MTEPYYKKLIKLYGLRKSPKLFAKILKEAKSYHKPGMTWRDIAVEIGVHPGSLSKYVTGTSLPKEPMMNKLTEYFDLTIQ